MKNMITPFDFQSLCGKYLIDMGVALEHPYIMSCLKQLPKSKSEKQEILMDIEETLKEEF
tara:strand:+ start:701 stop:880 length:180 start_codon:yes stop_codon:yes gene_type:complete